VIAPDTVRRFFTTSLDLKVAAMPSTVNGVGTHYYGRKNQTARIATCKSCGRAGNLQSYDTRLWFVIVFIPIIPLGRKRIIDQCPTCTRHYAMKADVYEQTKQLQTSGSLERFRREPSAELALEAHGQLLGFHEHQQAAEFRETALARFKGHAGLRAGMAAQLRDMSLFSESAKLFQEAFDLDPDLPAARVGVAQQKMGTGQLDEALKLLDFLMEPGAGQGYSLEPLNSLAGYFQSAGRHSEAIKVAGVLLRELPDLKDDHIFRKFVSRSEKAVSDPESILPARSFSLGGLFRSKGSPFPPWQRKLAIGSIAAILLAGGLAINNEYIRRHRTLHVLNATGQPAQVQVDGLPGVSVTGMGRLTVPEGPHVINVSGPVNETSNIDIASSYFERWFSTPAWVLNLGGEAVLEDITHVYSANGTPGQRRLLVGQPFLSRAHVDYIFTNAPSQMKVKNKTENITKTEIGWVQSDDLTAFMETIDTNRKTALDFAEKRLKRNPNQGDLLKYYLGQSEEKDRGRIEAFLKSDLDRRPVSVPWHRAYQTIAELNNHETELVSLYDKLLEAEPASAALQYLRGRIDLDWEKQESFYSKAIELDPKLGWPWIARAARASTQGRWDDCLKAARKARELNINEPEQIDEFIHDARMAKGEAKALVDEYRAGRAANPMDVSSILFLVDALAASGKESEINSAISTWIARLPVPAQGEIAPYLRASGLYHAGKLKECAEFCRANAVVKSTPFHLHALLALGRMKDATEDSVFGTLWGDPMNLLAVSVGFRLDGKLDESARWREKARTMLTKVGGATDVAKAAKFLSALAPPAIKEVREVYLPPANKALVLAALADQFPAGRDAYLAEALKFNISRKPAFYLIERATAKKTPEHP
jgi:tetratricopeptide (TPR) repeat protein